MEDDQRWYDDGDGRLPMDRTTPIGDLQYQLKLKRKKKPYSLESFFSFSKRLATFEKWPVMHSLKSFNLAQAGFCYTGVGDVCFCPWCEVFIDNWNYLDEPFGKHKEVSSSFCTYLHYLFPTNLIDIVRHRDIHHTSSLVIDESA